MAALADLEKKYMLTPKRMAYMIPGRMIHLQSLCFCIKACALKYD
jgi:hypothetical protein